MTWKNLWLMIQRCQWQDAIVTMEKCRMLIWITMNLTGWSGELGTECTFHLPLYLFVQIMSRAQGGMYIVTILSHLEWWMLMKHCVFESAVRMLHWLYALVIERKLYCQVEVAFENLCKSSSYRSVLIWKWCETICISTSKIFIYCLLIFQGILSLV